MDLIFHRAPTMLLFVCPSVVLVTLLVSLLTQTGAYLSVHLEPKVSNFSMFLYQVKESFMAST